MQLNNTLGVDLRAGQAFTARVIVANEPRVKRLITHGREMARTRYHAGLAAVGAPGRHPECLPRMMEPRHCQAGQVAITL
jgi:hypothetical protein